MNPTPVIATANVHEAAIAKATTVFTSEEAPVKCELFYSSGGHGGPYASAELAIAEAKRKLLGCRSEHSIEVRLASDFRTVVSRIYREQAEAEFAKPSFVTNTIESNAKLYRKAAKELKVDIIVMTPAVGAWHKVVPGCVGIFTDSHEHGLALMNQINILRERDFQKKEAKCR